MRSIGAPALALGLLLATACAPADEGVVAGERATRPPPSAGAAVAGRSGAAADDGWMTGLGKTGVVEAPSATTAPTAPVVDVPASATAPGATAETASSRRVGALAVTLVESERTDDGVRAAFEIENRGTTPAVVSPGNYRLRTGGARPRMQLKDTPAPLPVGTLQPGQSLRGEVTWQLPEGDAVAVAFVNGGDGAEWALAG